MRQAPGSAVMRLAARAGRVARQKGLGYAVRAGLLELTGRMTSSYPYYALVKSRRTFVCGGQRYRYFYHRYNTTWKTERAVEVPVVWEVVRARAGARVLEVGNVLSHYFPVSHDIVDKYERAPGVRNEDIVDFQPGHPYDLIVSISTIEHVGWDEQPREPEKALRAIAHLRALLAPGGTMVVTLPLAYNPALDEMLRDGRIQFTRRLCLQRISRDNRWAEVAWPAIAHAGFNHPYRGINGLVIGFVEG